MRDIKNFEGLYGITSCGRVWSYRSQKFLKPRKNKVGYLTVLLSVNGVKKNLYIHRLVAEAYIPNPNNLPQVNHKNENKDHNWINNLEWCNAKYNANYGTRSDWCKKKVKCIETGEIYDSITSAAKSINKYRQGIGDCARGIQKTCGGFHWEFVEGEV